MRILGISAFYHDSAAALVRDGDIIAAAQEERFTRKKHDPGFPQQAIDYCLQEDGCKLEDVDHVVFYDKPFLKFERLLETYLAFAPRGFTSFRMAIPVWLKEKLFQKDLLTKKLQESRPDFDWAERLLFGEHHQSHAASAFYPSPFEEAVVLTMDGVGEWATTSAAIGKGNKMDMVKEIHFPHSIGLLYSAFTYYTGFKVNSGEYKVMGLAPYGEPRFVDKIFDNLVDLKDDGSYRLDMKYFDYATGLTMTNDKFADLFGAPTRIPEDKPGGKLLEQRDMDLAASVQKAVEIIVDKLARGLRKETGQKYLCLAGGVALNCVANGKLLRDNIFDDIWIQPASGDAGGALGAALSAYHGFKGGERKPLNGCRDRMLGSFLGPVYEQSVIEKELTEAGAKFDVVSTDDMLQAAAQGLADEKAVGWFQGRMEFGPRALGGRSILGDPRSAKMQKQLNLKVKFRESFRPFAPSCLAEDVSDYFDHDRESPYMLIVAPVLEKHRIPMTAEQDKLFGIEKLNVIRSSLPAITHVDYSARIQSIHEDTNPLYWGMLKKFKALTGCPVCVNTSFNVRGEPIVGSPADAFNCFMGTHMDMLVIGNCVLKKEDQDPALAQDYKDKYELD